MTATKLISCTAPILLALCTSFPVQAQETSSPQPVPVYEPCLTVGPYIVFFSWGSAEFEGDAVPILDLVLRNWQGCEQNGVEAVMALDGHVDTSEPAGVSRARSEAVRAYFREHGVPENRLRRFDCGPRQLRVNTIANVREPQNRRIEITFGPPEWPRLTEAPGCDTMQP